MKEEQEVKDESDYDSDYDSDYNPAKLEKQSGCFLIAPHFVLIFKTNQMRPKRQYSAVLDSWDLLSTCCPVVMVRRMCEEEHRKRLSVLARCCYETIQKCPV